ncbi:MAG TPA: type II toxin-antitoxin system VapB family antitoxin [Terracidiphilus sp.]|nr:type II toxin-antitoxin system VapB family antitoxin [Terracidiphilus sp.]
MSLNIKNPETVKLAQELARENGETVTTAVTIALRERLERQREAATRESRVQWLERITKDTAAIMNDGRTSKELMDELYDEETGLPK